MSQALPLLKMLNYCFDVMRGKVLLTKKGVVLVDREMTSVVMKKDSARQTSAEMQSMTIHNSSLISFNTFSF